MILADHYVEMQNLLRDELSAAVKRMKHFKATGPNVISLEAIKEVMKVVPTWLWVYATDIQFLQ